MKHQDQDWQEIGKIGKPRGLRGEFFLSGVNAKLSANLKGLNIIVSKSDPNSGIPQKIEAHNFSSDRDLLKLKDFPDRTAIETIFGQNLWIKSSDLQKNKRLEKKEKNKGNLDSFLNRSITDPAGLILGVSIGFQNFGGVDNIELHDTAKNKNLMIPFVKEYFPLEKTQTQSETLALKVTADYFADFWYDA